MPTEAEIRAALAQADRVAAEHPEWTAFVAWARQAQALYEASRRQWRAQNPMIDVAALEGDYELTPAAPAIKAAAQV